MSDMAKTKPVEIRTPIAPEIPTESPQPEPEAVVVVVEEQVEIPKPSIVVDVLRMKREWQSQRQAAIDELLKRQAEIKAQLAELEYEDPKGYDAEPEAPAWAASGERPGGSQPKRKYQRRKPGTRKTSKSAGKFCPVCNAETPTYPHDARSHRNQTKKKPFTEAELKALAAK